MVVEKNSWFHITLLKITWPSPRLSQAVTEITAGDAINKETRVHHVYVFFFFFFLGGGGGVGGVPLVQFSKSMCLACLFY